MKKLIVIFCLLFLTACTDDTSYDIYYEIKDNLMSQTIFTNDYPFDVEVVFNEIDDYYRYDIIIDDAQENMYNITAMAYCNEEENKSCPVIGVFEEDPYHIIPNVVDKEKHYYKGVQLSGTCDEKLTVKVYISYYLDEGETDFQEYYIEVNGL